MQYDLIVVGGSLIGLGLALTCAQKGLKVLVLEAKCLKDVPIDWDPDCKIDSRVFAVNRASEELFKEIGVWPGIIKRRSFSYDAMEVSDIQSAAALRMTAAEVLQPNLGFIIEQQVCLQALIEQVQKESKITVLSPVVIQTMDVTETDVTVMLANGDCFRATLIVGADGAGSWVRKHFQMPVVREEYGQTAVVATIRPAVSPEGMAYQCFDTTGPLALLPMGENVSIVWSTMPQKAAQLCQLPVLEFEKELTLQSQHRLGHLSLVSKRHLFPLAMQHAKTYVLPRVALVGDAAHTFHPLAGQGLNAGLRDVRMLRKILVEAQSRGQDIGHLFVLKRYQRAVIGHNLALIAAMKALQWGFATSLQPVKLLREFGLNRVAKQSFVKRWCITQALGLQDI